MLCYVSCFPCHPLALHRSKAILTYYSDEYMMQSFSNYLALPCFRFSSPYSSTVSFIRGTLLYMKIGLTPPFPCDLIWGNSTFSTSVLLAGAPFFHLQYKQPPKIRRTRQEPSTTPITHKYEDEVVAVVGRRATAVGSDTTWKIEIRGDQFYKNRDNLLEWKPVKSIQTHNL